MVPAEIEKRQAANVERREKSTDNPPET